MTALILAVSLLTQTPAELHAAALGDLVRTVPVERHRDTMYVSLHAALAGPDRESLWNSVLFALSSTSFRSIISTPSRTYNGLLVRISLASLGWDVGSRRSRIARLKEQGVDTTGFSEDLWEEIVKTEPYFFADSYYADGKLSRGWLDPTVDKELRTRTHASKAIVRADWLIPRLLREAQEGGIYSQALLLPSREADLYRAFGVDQKLVDSDPQLRNGGAVLDSIVALHNRELQVVPSLYGYDERFIWRTFDFNRDETGDRSVIDRLAGTVKHDGREIIGTLPNGLHWYYLADGAGKQVAVVPQNIAIDNRPGTFSRIRDRNVSNPKACIGCHSESGGGLQPFDDVISKAILSPRIGLAVFAYGKEQGTELLGNLQDYYLSDLSRKIARQNASYAERLKLVNGLTPQANGLAIEAAVDGYSLDLVTFEQAAREMGQDPVAARIMLRASGNPYNNLLSVGQPIRRAAWEQGGYLKAQYATQWPWESKN